MKKIKQTLLVLLLIILSINIFPQEVHAEDDGYYIKNMNVNVDVNDKREFKITEKIDVYFNEERHGIIRDIPKSTRLEDYEIKDISVDGAPYEIDDLSSLKIKIGDEDETVTEEKTYVISYTIKNYSDEQPEGDYIYLNVLGDQWDTKIENFTSTITYPKNANLEKINITDGEYGSKDSTNSKYNVEGNKIFIKSTKTINPYNAITVNAMLNEGAFKNAPVRQYPYVIENEAINIDITEEKQYVIERDFRIKMNKDYVEEDRFTLDMLDIIKGDNFYLLDMNVDDKNIYYSKDYGVIRLDNKSDEYNFKVSYTIEPRLSNDIEFKIVSPHLDGKVENLKVSVNSPIDINDATIDFNERGVNVGTDRYKFEKNKNSLIFTNNNTINPGESITLKVDMDNGLFTRPLPKSAHMAKGGAPVILVVAIFLYFIFRDKNQVVSAVEFYPPRHMNSTDVGYAFNEHINNLQATTLLFYWASQGHIKITMKKKDKFSIEKLKDLEDNHKPYEKILFHNMFKHGNGKSVSDSELKYGCFAEDLSNTCTRVREEFKGEKVLRDKKPKIIGFLLSVVSAIPLVLSAMASKDVNHGTIGMYVILSILLIIVHLVFYLIFYQLFKKRKGLLEHKGIGAMAITSFVYLIIMFLPFIFSDLDKKIVGISILVSLIGNILSAHIPRRNEYGKKLLGEIIGFRNFIEVAEKERLEALLEEDPEYFYNTLPYAQVLGVTKKWTDKFKGITMQQPTYYQTYYPLNDYIAISRFVNDLNKVESTVSYDHSSSSDSSFGGGSGGGFGGGGFSGGGSGGGGGSSW